MTTKQVQEKFYRKHKEKINHIIENWDIEGKKYYIIITNNINPCYAMNKITGKIDSYSPPFDRMGELMDLINS